MGCLLGLIGIGLVFGLGIFYLASVEKKEEKAKQRAKEILAAGRFDNREELDAIIEILGKRTPRPKEYDYLCEKLLELRDKA